MSNILKTEKTVPSNNTAWQEYFNGLKENEDYLVELIQNTDDLSKLTSKDLVNANKAARKAVLEHNAALQKQTLASKAAAAGMKLLSTVGSMFAFALIGKGIELAASLIDNWIHRVDNANEAMSNAVSEYEAHKSELQDINSELETTSQRIDELLAKDKLSFTEKNELEELQKITKELLLQQDIEERRMDQSSKEAADKAVDAYKKQFGSYDVSRENLNRELEFQKTNRTVVPESEDDVTGNIAAYLNAVEALNSLQKEYDNAVKNGEDTSLLSNDLTFSRGAVQDYRNLLDRNISDLQEKRLALETEYNKILKDQENSALPFSTSDKKIIKTYEDISEALKMIYEYSNPNAWNSMEISSVLSTQGLEKTKEELIAMANAGTLSPETIRSYTNLNAAIENSELFLEEGQTAAEAFCNEISAWAEESARLADASPVQASSFTEALSQIQSLSNGLTQLSSIYEDISNKSDFDWASILNNDSFRETFGSIEDSTGSYRSAYDRFLKAVSNSPDDISACRSAFDSLASSYLYNSDALDSLTEETGKATASMLEQMGIANAKDIVDARLEARQKALKLGLDSLNLSSIAAIQTTYDNIAALVTEGEVCGATASALYQLVAQETIFSNSSLNTSQKIAELERLAQAFGITADSAVSAAQIHSMISRSFTSADGYNLSREEIEEATLAVRSSQIQKQIQEKFGTIAVNYAPAGSNSSAGSNASAGSKTASSGSSSAPAEASQTFDWLETRLDRLNQKTATLNDAFSNAYGPDAKNEAYLAYLSAIEEEIDANSAAIAYYRQRLNEIGLSYEWIARIQSGAFDISTVTDQTLIDQIQQYQSFYEKILGYQNTVEALEQQRQKAQADHARDVTDTYSQEIDAFQKIIDKQKAAVSLKEVFGGSASKKELETQQNAVNRQINRIEEQNRGLDQLIRTTAYGSEAWQIYHDKIEENKDSILDFTQSLADLAKEIASLPLDKLDAGLEKISQKKEQTDAKLANATTVKEQNKLINRQMSLTRKENLQTQKAAAQTEENLGAAIEDFSSAKMTDKKYVSTDQQKKIDGYDKQIKTYTKGKKKIPASLITQLAEEGHSNLAQAAVNYNAALEANDTAQAAAALSAETTKTELAALAKTKFDYVQAKYERIQSRNTRKTELLSSRMDLASEKGYLDSETYYRQLMAYEQENQENLRAEAAALQKRLDDSLASGKIEKYSGEWQEMTEAIWSVNEALEKGGLTLQQYKNQLEQIKSDNFAFLQQQISRLTSESDFLIDLMADKSLTDDSGLTAYGNAALGLHYQNYDTYLKQAETYGEEIARINRQLAENPYHTTLISQLQERKEAQRDCILAAGKEKDAVIDLKKQGYDALSASLSTVISKYKESLRSARDARDYRKNIAKQSETIDALQRKITAYSSLSGNEEIAARLQQANKELAEARENLEETMYDKYISDTEDILDDLLDELGEYIDELLRSADSEFAATRETVNRNAEEIRDTLSDLSVSCNTSLSSAMEKIWGNGYTPEKGFSSILAKMDALIAASNAQADQQADALVYEEVNSAYNKNISAYDNNVADAQTRLEHAKIREAAVREMYQEARTEQNNLRQQREEIAKKYGVNSSKYRQANADYLSAENRTAALKAELTEAKADTDNAQSNYHTAVKEREGILASNKAALLDFLNRIVNANPEKSQEEMTGLDRAVYQLTGGYITDYNVGQLADLLGTGASADEILAVLDKLGFSYLQNVTPVSSMKYSTSAGPSTVFPELSLSRLEENLPSMSRLIDTTLPVYQDRVPYPNAFGGNVSISFGDLTLPDVTDSAEFAATVEKTMRNAICSQGRTAKCLTEAIASRMTDGGIGKAGLYR